ncbi:AbrB family transcriptional regulator [Candidatus Pacearchaeota archaeon RBG_19FT_COMBO_34_9]|nr:MAG: AbrB family transcriptional regulator [Candidatus Pacearchaeota archaeon RBG_19FT_COMBO_34_9]OGJ16198.1 MAG: AbrB family transcriptional regulator [Candidatus Pacearchaeota archaeon RBG_13_33_26]
MNRISITRMSSKGQIVIPADMREGIEEGDKLVIIRNKNHIILKKEKDFSERLEEDMEFARRTEEAWKRIEKGEFISINSENLFEEMDKW